MAPQLIAQLNLFALGYLLVELAVHGNPCRAADFCIIGPYSQETQAGSDFFSKYPNVYTNGQDAPYRAKNRIRMVKENTVFQQTALPSQYLQLFWLSFTNTNLRRAGLSIFQLLQPYHQVWPDLLRNKSGQTQPDVRRSWKRQCYGSAFVQFLSSFLHFHRQYLYEIAFFATTKKFN